jgi:hypothetical protein
MPPVIESLRRWSRVVWLPQQNRVELSLWEPVEKFGSHVWAERHDTGEGVQHVSRSLICVKYTNILQR